MSKIRKDMTQIDFFKKNGYLVLENIISTKVIEDTFSFLNGKVEEYLNVLNLNEERDFREVAIAIKNSFQTLDEKEKHLLSGHFDLETRLNKSLFKIFDHAEVLKKILKEL